MMIHGVEIQYQIDTLEGARYYLQVKSPEIKIYTYVLIDGVSYFLGREMSRYDSRAVAYANEYESETCLIVKA